MTDSNTTALALRSDDGPRAIIPQSFAEAKEMAEYLGKSGLLPAAMNKGAPAVFAIIAAGSELRMPPMASLRNFYINSRTGTPGLYAEAQTAIVVSRSDICEYLYPVEQTATRATWATKRRGHPTEVRASWDLERAKVAGLLGKDTYKAHPGRMLSARAKSDLCRDVYPDLVGGLPTEYDEPIDAESTETFTRPEPPAQPQPAVVAQVTATPRRARTAQAVDSTGLVTPTPKAAPEPEQAPATPLRNDVGPATVPAGSPGAIGSASFSTATPRPDLGVGPAPAARADYEASAARVAQEQRPPADERDVIDADFTDAPASVPAEVTAFRAAMAAAKHQGEMRSVRGKYAPWSQKPENAAWGPKFKEEYLARFNELPVDPGAK